jgi:hypothetical protein
MRQLELSNERAMFFKQSLLTALDRSHLTRSILWRLYDHKYRHVLEVQRQTDVILQEVSDSGICIIPRFWPAEKCAMFVDEVKGLFADFPEAVHHPQGELPDYRIYGADKLSPSIAEFATDAVLTSWIKSYAARPLVFVHTLLNMVPMPADFGSGGMWHRDEFLPSLKCILYLTDVTADNGPLQLISHSHRWGKHYARDHERYGFGFRQNRLGKSVDDLVKNEPERRVSVTGEAGTLAIFDVSAIHRGSPLRSGERIALTNYYAWKLTRNVLDLYSPRVVSANTYEKDRQLLRFGTAKNNGRLTPTSELP